MNWWPEQTDHATCPVCGGGTVALQAPVSDDADTLYRLARDAAAMRDAYAYFEHASLEYERLAA